MVIDGGLTVEEINAGNHVAKVGSGDMLAFGTMDSLTEIIVPPEGVFPEESEFNNLPDIPRQPTATHAAGWTFIDYRYTDSMFSQGLSQRA